jgi:hypothetical protein
MSVPSENIIELSELRIGNILEYRGRLVHVTLLDMDIEDAPNLQFLQITILYF